MIRTTVYGVTAALVIALAVSACSPGDEPGSPSETSTPPRLSGPPDASTSPEQTATSEPGEAVSLPSHTYLVAIAGAATIEIFDSPGDPEPARVLHQTDLDAELGGDGQRHLVFLVKDSQPEWLDVYLPVRPNGSTGWLRREDVSLAGHNYRVEVRLSEHRITVFDGDLVVLDEPVGVGRESTPTPGGVYYIKELLQPPHPDGVYGVYAYGLSGFSNVLTEFAGGDAVIGIHGTNEPDRLGTDVSSGCIRLHNDAITRLVEDIGLPLGTPVEIHP